MMDNFQNNFLNNNDLITPVSSCAIRANVALELNAHSVKKKKGEFLMTSSTCGADLAHTCFWFCKTKSTI